jgi:anti-sigma B factor antagonist
MLTIEPTADGIALVGRLDAAQAGVAQAALDAVRGVVTLDCRRLDYVSSAGLSVLLRTQKRLLPASGKLRLAGLQPHIRDIFVYSGFDQLFEIVADPGKDSPNFPAPRA